MRKIRRTDDEPAAMSRADPLIAEKSLWLLRPLANLAPSPQQLRRPGVRSARPPCIPIG